ncbi:hypothetical protein H4S07_000542 [Coemansia furcata]|uniref:Uncharacterized protein n=1 Tax=Coemansia furcata TaxID=417177 RepID=A0ACC1LQY6_9FUNG|nr:hypothetical protein H4S07_000542 [Coemansia furcata]
MATSSTPRLTLTMRLAPPLPPRKFLFVCQQKTVKELKNEIRRRLIALIKEPVAITVDGYELMDDDDVADVLSKDTFIVLHLAASLDQAIAEQLTKAVTPRKKKTNDDVVLPEPVASPPARLTIRKREHGNKKGAELVKRAKPLRVYPAELAYEQAKSDNSSPSSDSDSSSDSSDASSSNESSDCGSSDSSEEHPVKVPLGLLSVSSADDEYVQDDIQVLRAESVDVRYLDKLANIDISELEVGSLVAYKVKAVPGSSNYFIGRVMETGEDDVTFNVIREVLPTDLPGDPLSEIPNYNTQHQVEHDSIVVAKLFK